MRSKILCLALVSLAASVMWVSFAGATDRVIWVDAFSGINNADIGFSASPGGPYWPVPPGQAYIDLAEDPATGMVYWGDNSTSPATIKKGSDVGSGLAVTVVNTVPGGKIGHLALDPSGTGTIYWDDPGSGKAYYALLSNGIPNLITTTPLGFRDLELDLRSGHNHLYLYAGPGLWRYDLPAGTNEVEVSGTIGDGLPGRIVIDECTDQIFLISNDNPHPGVPTPYIKRMDLSYGASPALTNPFTVLSGVAALGNTASGDNDITIDPYNQKLYWTAYDNAVHPQIWSASTSGSGNAAIYTSPSAGGVYRGLALKLANPGCASTSTGGGVNACWDSRFGGLNGLNGYGQAIVADASHHLYVGGSFTSAGGVGASNIARWDGVAWTPLGAGMNGPVYALAVDGSGNLYAGGAFTVAGGVSANHVAKWDGAAWSALDVGTNATVFGLAVDNAGNVYAGGSFTTAGGVGANCIAEWNGSIWSAFGTGMGTDGFISPAVTSIKVDEVHGKMYAGGTFGTAGGVTATYMAQWNGSSWSAMGSGTNGYVYGMAMDASGNVYPVGGFTIAGGASANNVAEWNGSSWISLGTGVTSSSGVAGVAVDGSGHLYVGGQITAAGGHPAQNLAMWNGSVWSSLGAGANAPPQSMVLDSDGDLFMAGQFTSAGGKPSNYVAHLIPGCLDEEGKCWDKRFAGSGGLDGYGQALATRGSHVYVGGSFGTAGGISTPGVADWSGEVWTALGTGMNGAVYALAADGFGNLYAGGAFTVAGGVSANHVAKWDGSTWSALGSGTNATVFGLTVDTAGNLYAGGSFTNAGGTSANCIAEWNGSTWSAFGTGMGTDGFISPAVTSIKVDEVHGKMYAGGTFGTAGGVTATYMAQWNGSSWSAMGTGTNGYVYGMAMDASGNVYPVGGYTIAGGASANNVAEWNGSSWISLGTGVSSSSGVAGVAVDGSGRVYVGGQITSAGGNPAQNLAVWNGSVWSALGEGANAPPQSLALNSDGDLYAAGQFTSAGGRPSNYIAHLVVDCLNAAPVGVAPNALRENQFLQMLPAVPNPTSQSTTVRFVLPRSGEVSAEVFDAAGRRVATLIDRKSMVEGAHEVTWDGRIVNGARARAGVYMVRLVTPGGRGVERVVMLR